MANEREKKIQITSSRGVEHTKWTRTHAHKKKKNTKRFIPHNSEKFVFFFENFLLSLKMTILSCLKYTKDEREKENARQFFKTSEKEPKK